MDTKYDPGEQSFVVGIEQRDSNEIALRLANFSLDSTQVSYRT
jgi:hypothetical protein